MAFQGSRLNLVGAAATPLRSAATVPSSTRVVNRRGGGGVRALQQELAVEDWGRSLPRWRPLAASLWASSLRAASPRVASRQVEGPWEEGHVAVGHRAATLQEVQQACWVGPWIA